MNTWERIKIKMIRGGQRGMTLVEGAVSVLLLGGGVLTMILAMSGGVLAVQENDEEVMAQALARSQMEYTKTYPFDALAVTYPAVEAPDDYTIDVTVAAVPDTNNNIQKVTAVITRAGKAVFTIQDYKVNR
jgi:Tfp pilus assembly protein PilV